ncbi:MAG: hypothetical protein ABEJ61_09205 [Haloferacaceae archaeon]
MALRPVARHPLYRQNPASVGLGALFVVVAAVQVWTRLVGLAFVAVEPALPAFAGSPIALGSVATYGLGMSLGALAYVRLRGIDLRVALPSREHLPTVAATTLAPAGLVLGTAAVAAAVDTTYSAIAQRYISPDAPTAFVLSTLLVPALAGAVGHALLYHGVVQERVRALTDPEHAVGLTTVLVGVVVAVPLTSPNPLSLDPANLAIFGVTLLVTVAVGASVGLLYRGTVRESVDSVRDVRYLPVVAVGLFGLVAAALELAEFSTAAFDLLRLATVAVAAYGYERTRTLLAPTLAVAAFRVTSAFVPYAEAVFGLASSPV